MLMKRISLSTELKDWVPGVYSTLESQLQFFCLSFSTSNLLYFTLVTALPILLRLISAMNLVCLMALL